MISLQRRLIGGIVRIGVRSISITNALQKTYYDTLGLSRNATQADIKNAYFELSKLYHPDRIAATDENLAKFREISAAYEILVNSICSLWKAEKCFVENFIQLVKNNSDKLKTLFKCHISDVKKTALVKCTALFSTITSGNEQSRKLYDRGLLGDFKKPLEETDDTIDPIVKFYQKRQDLSKSLSQTAHPDNLSQYDWSRKFFKEDTVKSEIRKKMIHKVSLENFKIREHPGESLFMIVVVFISLGLFATNFENTAFEILWRNMFG